jgi:hypothetical protein
VFALSFGDVGVFSQLLGEMWLVVGFIVHWSNYPDLVGCSCKMLLDYCGIVVGVAFANFQSLAAEGADVAALSSPAALTYRDNLEVETAVLVELSHLYMGSIGMAFRDHIERTLSV